MKFGDPIDKGQIRTPDVRPYVEDNLVPQTLQRNLQISYQGNRNSMNPARSGNLPVRNLPRG